MKDSMITNSRKEALTFVFLILAILPVLIFSSGCGVRNANVDPGEAIEISQFSGRKIAILPVHGDNSLGTDSQLQLKKKINTKLDKKISNHLTQARIIGTKQTIQILNNNGKLTVLDDLVKPYKSVGVFDNKIVKSLFSLLSCDYLVISELDHENIDVIAANAYLLSLDVLIVNRRNEIVWSGTGDFKQGGMFGIGRVSNTQGAQEVVDLAFAYWSAVDNPSAGRAAPVRKEIEIPVRKGDPQVQSVQRLLNEQNYSPGVADGFMGNKTRIALEQYQQDQGIAVTGRIDNTTLVALGLRQPSTSTSDTKTIRQAPPSPATQDQKNSQAIVKETPVSVKYITTISVDLQSADDFFADSLAKVPANTELDVLSQSGDWYKISFNKQVGYVLAEFVEKR